MGRLRSTGAFATSDAKRPVANAGPRLARAASRRGGVPEGIPAVEEPRGSTTSVYSAVKGQSAKLIVATARAVLSSVSAWGRTGAPGTARDQRRLTGMERDAPLGVAHLDLAVEHEHGVDPVEVAAPDGGAAHAERGHGGSRS